MTRADRFAFQFDLLNAPPRLFRQFNGQGLSQRSLSYSSNGYAHLRRYIAARVALDEKVDWDGLEAVEFVQQT